MKISPKIKEKIVVLVFLLVYLLGYYVMLESYELMTSVAAVGWSIVVFKIFDSNYPEYR